MTVLGKAQATPQVSLSSVVMQLSARLPVGDGKHSFASVVQKKSLFFFLVGAFFSLRAPLNQAQEAGRKKSACTKAGRKPQLSPFSTNILSALSVDFKASVSSTLRERSCYIVIKNSEGFQSFSASTACREYDCLPVMYKASGLACMPKRENAANSM